MDFLLMVLYCVLILAGLVYVHELGHYLAAKFFKVRCTELMLGLPGPKLSLQRGETKFGVTVILLGGYAKICGMSNKPRSKYGKHVFAEISKRGSANIDEIANAINIPVDDAEYALEELEDWGCVTFAQKTNEYNTFRTSTNAQHAEGEVVKIDDLDSAYKKEESCQYSSLPFWKRTIILLAGIFMNLFFAMLIFIIVYSIIGLDAQLENGEIQRINMNVIDGIRLGFMYVHIVAQAIVKLFNPLTFQETIQNSVSIVGIAVISKIAAEAGIQNFLFFIGSISISLGLMNLLPIPPLDGGRFVIEIIQRVSGKLVPEKAISIASAIGFALLILLFIVMLNHDIYRVLTGFWS
ncbi:MAG: site-2 protease family protein [Eggerthellaceae bacterium]|nr:site-2 protease family protein [Eggerthellaceae bacterium]